MKYQDWQHPGATTGLLYFGRTKPELAYDVDGLAMKGLRKKVVAAGREDLLGLLKGWTACRVDACYGHFFQVPGEGVIRSIINAVRYLEALVRLKSGAQPLTGAHPKLQPPLGKHTGQMRIWTSSLVIQRY